MASSTARLVTELLGTIPGRRFSQGMGQLASLSPPRVVLDRVVSAYVKAYGVSMVDVDVPAGGFRTFDDFFTRRLVSGARPLDPDPSALVSPCDGKVLDRGPVDMGGTLRIKGRLYRVSDLVGERDAARYDGGDFGVIYLSPRDYHRVHSPASGKLVAIEHVPGLLLPVNALGVRFVPQLFARNERLTFHLETDAFGPVCLVMVGAVGVGRITTPFDDLTTNDGRGEPTTRRYEPAQAVARGAEIGTFHLGSTVVLFLAPGRASREGPSPGGDVLMGQSIGRALESA